VLTDFQPANTLGNLGIFARLLNSPTEIRVSQHDAALVAARGIDNLPGRDRTVSLNPVAPPPTVSGGQVSDLLAITVSRCRRELSHCEPRRGVDSLAGLYQEAKSPSMEMAGREPQAADSKEIRLPEVVKVGSGFRWCRQPL
jgi:hypothetical protein